MKKSTKRGAALLYAVIGVFVAGAMVTVMMTVASATNTRSNLKRDVAQGRHAAEGVIEAAKKQMQTAAANWLEVETAGTMYVGSTPVEYSVTPTGEVRVVTYESGFQQTFTPYEVRAQAEVERSKPLEHRIVELVSTPIFQYAVFYDDDLEVQPGPAMELVGRIHTNSDMYLGCGDTLTLNTNHIRVVGDVHRRRKDSDASPGTVEIREWVTNPFDGSIPATYNTMYSRSEMDAFGVTTDSGYDSDFVDGYDADGDGIYEPGDGDFLPFDAGALEYWDQADGYTEGEGHTLLTGAHGVTEAVAPGINALDMFTEAESGGTHVWDAASGTYVESPGGTHVRGFFHGEADLVILVMPDGSIQGFDGDGAAVDVPFATTESVYDARQGGDVPIVKIDLEGLVAPADGEELLFPENGLLYVSHYGMGAGDDARGVMLTNGSSIGRALTLATDGAAYVHGDYNVDDKRGCAVIADALNLLSNAWDGSKEVGELPTAAATSYNLAFITGNQITSGSAYNGGLENLPRFHEKWSGVPCRIRGSFVNLWESQYATGEWLYGGDRYQAPIRDWGYDEDFNDPESLPPYTPLVVTARNVVSW